MIKKRNIILVIILSVMPALGASAQHTYNLEQLLDSARAHNIALRNGERDIETAQEQRKEAFTKYFPSVSATGAWFNANKSMAQTELDLSPYITPELGASLAQLLPPETLVALSTPMSISMMKHGTIASITAIQPLFAGGQIVNGNKLAKIGEEVSRLQLELTEDEVETTTEQYFWQLVTLEEKQRTIAAVEEMLNDIHKDVSMALEAGLILRNDLLKVELRQNEVESQKVKICNGISLMHMLLAQYCGLRDTSFRLIYNNVAPSPLTLKRDHQQALLATPEYQLLDKQVEATLLQKKMAVGENLPSVAVGAGYNYHNLLGNDRTFGMVFATVSVPISSWWGGSHAIKRKKIAQQQAIDQRSDNAELLTIRMQKAWNDVEEAYQQLTIAERSIQQSEENLRISRNCYRAGTTTMSDLLEAQMLHQQSLDKRTDAFADYQNKVVAYKHAVGM
ncbi:MAG: TolC family protein [Prevotella sp.]|nr:TolC family protein [Prevotella sp.]